MNTESFAGNAIRAMVYACLQCPANVVIYDPNEPNLTVQSANNRVKDKGWTQRRGAWHCLKCTKQLAPAAKPKLAAIERGAHLSVVK